MRNFKGEQMVTVTEQAVSQVTDIMKSEQKEGLILRLGVGGGGCSGLEYYMGFDEKIADSDETFESFGLKIVVDKESMPYLDGTTLDFSNDMMNSGFVFNNPNAARTCGCGKSFCG